MTMIETVEQARADGLRHGEEDGDVLFHENHEAYGSEIEAVSGLDNCAYEAALELRIPRDFRDEWMEAYERGAARVILSLYRDAIALARAEAERDRDRAEAEYAGEEGE